MAITSWVIAQPVYAPASRSAFAESCLGRAMLVVETVCIVRGFYGHTVAPGAKEELALSTVYSSNYVFHGYLLHSVEVSSGRNPPAR